MVSFGFGCTGDIMADRWIDEYLKRITQFHGDDTEDEAEVNHDLTNFDLIQEVGQLESYIAIAKEKGKVSEEFNHSMLEYAIDDFEEALQEAIIPFVSKVTERLHEVYKELNK